MHGQLLEIVRRVVVPVFRRERATILRLRMVARDVQGTRPKRATKELVQEPEIDLAALTTRTCA